MKTKSLIVVLAATFSWSLAGASSTPAVGSENEQLKTIVQNLLKDNDEFVKSHDPEYFKPFADGQKPRATVVTCSDSRVHTHALDKAPDGDLFMVRNIGNQLRTGEGSVEYGVHHLHTPLLIFVGHSACGAIKAASSDYRRESPSIKRELVNIRIPKGVENMAGVKLNVNNQVATAVKKFSHEIHSQKLTVVGAIYDFRNDLGQGQGRLVITNINGSNDSDKIKTFLSMSDAPLVSAARTGSSAPPAERMRPHPYAYP
ncbi:MAG: carbonic anhydrase [Sulfuricella sp.]|nr:carbonic anhydrase [Sulfuricella sp.]